MNCALIIAGIVANLTVGCPPGDKTGTWVASNTARIGDTYSNGVFTTPPVILAEPVKTPTELDALKARLDKLEAASK